MTMLSLAKWVFILFFSVISLGYIYHLLTRRYLNPYKLTMIFKRKRCG